MFLLFSWRKKKKEKKERKRKERKNKKERKKERKKRKKEMLVILTRGKKKERDQKNLDRDFSSIA